MSYSPDSLLEGQINARDLGGIKGFGGAHIAKNRLVRSGELSKATDGDLLTLTHIRLKTVVDLRSDPEIALKQDRLPDGVLTVRCPVVSELVPGITRESVEDPYDGLRRADYAADLKMGGKAKMRSLYPILVESEQSIRQYRRFFEAVLGNDDGALLFHCAMGKDRAGVAAALLLYALGADMQDIMADYMYTGICCAEKIRRDTSACRELTENDALIREIFWLNMTDESYLESMFESCKKQCGSVDKFLEQRLGLTADKLSKLRKLYLI